MSTTLPTTHLQNMALVSATLLASITPVKATTLDMTTLPSTQGWQYESNCTTGYTCVSETPTWSNVILPPSALYYDTIGTGQSSSAYVLPVVLETGTLDYSITARVLSVENGVRGNNYGFGFTLAGSMVGEQFGVQVGVGQSEIDAFNDVLTTSIDTSQFHKYDLIGSFSTSFNLLVDGQQVGDVPIHFDFGASSPVPGDTFDVLFGDLSGLTNAAVDITAVSITQDVPEPSSLTLLGVALAGFRVRPRRKRVGSPTA
jgi:PEP-CTERM motif-containing protein